MAEPYVRVRDLERDLKAKVDAEVRFDPGSRGTYSTDSSNYRQVPLGVVVPRTVEAGVEAVRVCAQHRAPVTSRGGGTSLAGQTCNVAVIIDWSKYCNHLISVDADGEDMRRRARHRAGRAQRSVGRTPSDVRPETGNP